MTFYYSNKSIAWYSIAGTSHVMTFYHKNYSSVICHPIKKQKLFLFWTIAIEFQNADIIYIFITDFYLTLNKRLTSIKNIIRKCITREQEPV